MTKREEFTFQKNIRKDIYAEAAIEGFTEVPPEEKSFFPTLAEEEEERKTKTRKRLVYTIIASVIIILIATSAYLVVEKKISVGQFRPFKFLTSQIPAVLPVVTDSDQIAAFSNAESMAQMTIPDIKSVPVLPGIVPDPAKSSAIADSLVTENNIILATTATSDQSNTLQSAPVSDPGTLIITDAPADAKNETGTSGNGSSDQSGIGQTGYVSPQPVTGNNSYNKYIEENLRKPQTLTEGENAVAVVSFVVRATGNIDSIKVLSSPGEEYTAEAIRLIKEGPAWKPAENNGRTIEDEKMLRIVFK